MNKPKDSLFEKWYKSPLIVIEMLKFHKNREMMFTKKYLGDDKLITHKYTMCNSFDRFNTIKGTGKIFDVYHHLEFLNTKEMPWELKSTGKFEGDMKRKVFDYSTFETERQWAFDIDCENLHHAYLEAKTVQKYMEWRFEVDSVIIFSGSKGFHVDCFLKGPAREVRRKNKAVYKSLLDKCPHLDNVYGRRRAWRTPYSLHGKTGLVCFPLSDYEENLLLEGLIENFLLSMHPFRVWREVRLVDRGYGKSFKGMESLET